VPAKPSQPVVTVRLSPIGFRTPPLNGGDVVVMVDVPAGTALWCPAVEVAWGVGGQVSHHEEDCKPEDVGQAYSYFVRGPAKWNYMQATNVVVRVSQGRAEVTAVLALRVVGGVE
jgi:hypothetical protein